ncbi:MAG: 50S ribosomal protein L16 [Candidatus Woesearchaeota archaeon]
MAKLRKGSAYNKEFKRPYTRKSKYRKKDFVRASPNSKVIRYEMGNLQKNPQDFDLELTLVTKKDLQIRHNALESARQSGNRILEKALGKSGYRMQLRKYPHHILRENALASGAGADRMSTGMAASFGKIIGLAAQVRAGEALFVVYIDKANKKFGKEALTRCRNKLPCSCQVLEVALK